MEPLPPLEPLPTLSVERLELVTVTVPVVAPLSTARRTANRTSRAVLLVHVIAGGVDGWAECAVEASPTYGPEFTAGARIALRDHLGPRLLAGRPLEEVRGHPSATAALELALIDAQLRVLDRSLAAWLGATEATVPAGATLGLHQDVGDLLTEADLALAAGAARLRVKVRPGSVANLSALVAHVAGAVPVQADANGSFRPTDTAHLDELRALDRLGLACLEQPVAPDDLTGSAAMAADLVTLVCLDEPITSPGAIETAAALRAAGVICLKPARVGGWPAAREAQHRARALGLGVWVGGMVETAIGRAANAAVAALPGMWGAPDLDPRPRYGWELAEPLVVVDGRVAVPTGPGTGVAPDRRALVSAPVDVIR